MSREGWYILGKESDVMTEEQFQEVSEAEIAVHWQEEEYFPPSPQFVAQANMTDPGMRERFGL